MICAGRTKLRPVFFLRIWRLADIAKTALLFVIFILNNPLKIC